MASNPKFKEIEESVTARWNSSKDKIFQTTQFDSKKPLFSWLEGPPTANAPPAIHHVEVRVFKDVFMRYKHMKGFSVPRQGGWDTHGLPVEVQVEKKLGLKHKKDVIEYGIPKFIEECKKDVWTFIEDWNRNTEKLGFWLDLDSAYVTLKTPYMESEWWALKEIYKKGLLYKGHKVVPYCPRCETPLSSHEVALGYEDVKEKTITIKFQLKDEEAKILAWTTTPWTLPGNVSLAVNANLDYCYVKDKSFPEETFIVAKDRVKRHFDNPEIIKTVKGKALVGKHYVPLFDYFPDLEKAYFIMAADYVTTEEGTGIVHQASAYGEIDYEENKKHDVTFIHPVEKDGSFSEVVRDFKGIFVKDADPLIIEKLEKEGKLFVTFDYTHSYPFCWRCKSPLLYYAMDSWFIKVSQIVPDLLKLNNQIRWYPDHIKNGRFGNWLEGAKDWALSRNKFWGTPLNIWVCDNPDCQNMESIGSIKELEEKSGKSGIDDLHLTTVDALKWKCQKCGGTMSRTPEVIDTWFDSGSAPFAQFHYPFENKALFEKRFPYDWIVEAIDQTRGWFYTLHVISTILFNKPAYKSCTVAGLLVDDSGEKMSKSKGNIISPDDVFGKYGIDATRLAMCSFPLGNPVRFGDSVFQENITPFLTILFNSYAFSSRKLVKKTLEGNEKVAVEDRWILSRLNSTIETVSKNLESHAYNECVFAFGDFVMNDLSRWYIKLVRDRDDEFVGRVLFEVFEKLMRLLAPFTPYLADYHYHKITGRDVHFESWPKAGKRDETLEADMNDIRDFITAVFNARDKSGVGVRWPLPKLIVEIDDKDMKDSVKKLKHLILEQTNVKELEIGRHDYSIEIKPDYRGLGKEFGQETADAIGVINANKAKIEAGLKKGVSEWTFGKFNILRAHLSITKHVHEGMMLTEFEKGLVFLDLNSTEELEAEGFTREVTRRAQALRKEAGLEKEDRIKLYVSTPYPMLKVDEIKAKVGADEIAVGKTLPKLEHRFAFKIKDFEFEIGF
ncbi:isoleucine--tRNA ligase [Candidatus Woesearchaeota archaeon]|nr:isoleucine--tRNA ligase [Candidatus Woesearchaeota archaeon]